MKAVQQGGMCKGSREQRGSLRHQRGLLPFTAAIIVSATSAHLAKVKIALEKNVMPKEQPNENPESPEVPDPS